MPSRDNGQDYGDRLQLLVNGRYHDAWESYEFESDLLTPADGFNMTMIVEGLQLPDEVRSGAAIELRIGGDLALTGRIDNAKSHVAKGELGLAISGRDLAGQLVDCSAPIMTVQQIELKDLVDRVVKPFGISKVRISAANAGERAKVSTEPCEKAWDAIQRAAEANGLWPWFEPDGTLIVGGPDYSVPPVATLVLRLPPNQKQNNVLVFDLDDSMADAYSEVTVLAQSSGGGDSLSAKHDIKGKFTDPSVPFHRPLVVTDHDIENSKQADDRARKLVMDSRLRRWTLTAQVEGHRINAPGMPGHDRLWQPGQRVNVLDETRQLQCTCFLMAVKRSGGAHQAARSLLTLKEDGVWIVAAHPKKKDKRRGKTGSGAVLDIGKAPEAGV